MDPTDPTDPTDPMTYSVHLIDPETDPRWDQFVEEHPYGWICHLSDWKRILEKSFPHIKGYHFALFNETGENIIAGIPIFRVRSWILGQRYVSVPFSAVCDPLISTREEFDILFSHISKFFGEENCRIELRSLNSSSLLNGTKSLKKALVYVHHYIDLNRSLEDIYKSFHRKSVRYCIKKAEKHGMLVKRVENVGTLRVFFKLYSNTRKSHGLPAHPFAFLRNIYEILSSSDRIEVLLAFVEDVPVGGILVYKFKKRVSAEYLGWDRRFKRAQPSAFLFWSSIKSAHRQGFGIYDFGRTEQSNVTLLRYKKRWGTRALKVPIYYFPENRVQKPLDVTLKYRIMTNLCKNLPDYIFSIISRFCYRHTG